jgi:hypothetical protein
MTSVSPTNDNTLTPHIIPGTPDQTSTGTSEQLPPNPNTDRELLALYHLFSPINLPEPQPIHALTYAQMVRREYLWTRIRKRLTKKKNKRQPPSPILSPITMASPLTTAPESNSSPPPTHTDLDSDCSLDIYFRAYANHRPEMGESNAESVMREDAIQQDVDRLKRQRKTKREERKINRKATHTNNVQEIKLESSENLYPNQNKRVTQTQHDFLYDTGAGLTMISGHPEWAWTNLRNCLYTIGGCFVGTTLSNLQIGQYHGIITLDSGETVRIVIPEAVQLPPNAAHSNLLANTAFLMAGHKFVSDLTQPKLKFKGGGQYTMSVHKGHNTFHALPISPQDETAHRKIYLHLDEPYEPPTYINNVIFQGDN